MSAQRKLLRLVRMTRLFVDCASQKEDSGCIVVHDDAHFAQMRRALEEAEEFLKASERAPS